MVVAKLKCQMCGTYFEAEILDKEDPNERHRGGSPVRCPKCNRSEIELLCVLRRMPSVRRIA